MKIGNKEISIKTFASIDSSICILIPTILVTKDIFYLMGKKEIRYFVEFQFLTMQLTLIIKIGKDYDTQDF